MLDVRPAPRARRSSRALRGAAVAAVGMALPERVVANAPIAERLGVSEEWIVKRTGVRERRLAGDGERLSELAARAAAEAVERAGLAAGDLGLVIAATMAPDDLTPNLAPLVAAEIGARATGAFDVGAACTGFLSALALAAAQVEAGRAGAVLVVGADLLSRLTDPDDRSTAALLADGAGAAVVVAAPAPGRVGPVLLGSDGGLADLIVARRSEGVIRMNGHDTFRQAVARMSAATLEALELAGRRLGDVDLFVYHQANSRIIRAVAAELGLDAARAADYVPRYGNTSAASIPIALATAEAEGRLWPGATVVLGAFGAGLTWGAAVLEWGGSGG